MKIDATPIDSRRVGGARGRGHPRRYGAAAALLLLVSLTAASGSEVARDTRDVMPNFLEPIAAPEGAPNVVIVLVDDLGFGDLGPYGSEISTPSIDRLARNGLRYTNFTVTALCSPTRAALLTGVNHHRAGVGFLSNFDLGHPGYRGEIAPDVMTLAEILGARGYSTLMTGKWHLVNMSHETQVGPFDNWPTGRGFERFWGFLDGEVNQFHPNFLVAGNEFVERVPDDFYFPDAMTDRAISMLKTQHAIAPEKPFFLYYAAGAVHAPHQAKPADIAKYRGRYDRGWDAVRAERLARQKQLGVVPRQTKLAGYDKQVRPWDQLDDAERSMAARFQELFAAFLDNLDQNVGRLVAHLEETGQLENTLFVILADNGGSRGGGEEGRANSVRRQAGAEDGNFAYNQRVLAELGSVTTRPNYPMGWMQVSNTPLSRGKATQHGGGNRSPLIVHWPNGIEARGETRRQFHHVTDIVPTVLEAAGVAPPATWRGLEVRNLDGVSMRYSFGAPDAPSRRTEQYYEIGGHRAFATADGWKIVAFADNKDAYTTPWDEAPWKLYQTDRDIAETDDLAAEFPERVAELEARFWEAAEANQVLPIDDRVYRNRVDRSRMLEKKRIVLRRGTETIPLFGAPMTLGRDFTITASIRREAKDSEGVLVAHGDLASGYSLFVKDNRLHYELNRAGDSFRLESPELPLGAIEVAFVFEQTSPLLSLGRSFLQSGQIDWMAALAGTGHLEVDGRRVASQELPAGGALPTWEGLDVGRDLRLPVTTRYEAPFEFQGELDQVVFDLR
ncbi:MAG: arylsulfatase [Myxococcota bacterium]